MLLRKPTKTCLKMEDDFQEYEDHKQKLFCEDRRNKSAYKMNPSAFMTPGSNKLGKDTLDLLPDEQNSGQFMTPRRERPGDNFQETHPRVQQSSEYVNSLLNNILPERRGAD